MTFEEFKGDYQKARVICYNHLTSRNPVVSICVQTYQHKNFIKNCLEGILMQETDFHYEILLGEDASADGTRDICKEYADKYPEKIRLFMHCRENNIKINNYPTGRFNFVYNLFSARGKYIAICEGDDQWTDPMKLQKQIDFLRNNGDYILSYHPFVNRYHGPGKKLPEKLKEKKPLPLCMVFRNIYQDIPRSMMKCPNADRFILTHLDMHGKFKYQPDIQPAIRNVHNGGVMSMIPRKQKLERQLKTWEAIHEAFSHTNREAVLRRRVHYFQLMNLKYEINHQQKGSAGLPLYLKFAAQAVKTGQIRELARLMLEKLKGRKPNFRFE